MGRKLLCAVQVCDSAGDVGIVVFLMAACGSVRYQVITRGEVSLGSGFLEEEAVSRFLFSELELQNSV